MPTCLHHVRDSVGRVMAPYTHLADDIDKTRVAVRVRLVDFEARQCPHHFKPFPI